LTVYFLRRLFFDIIKNRFPFRRHFSPHSYLIVLACVCPSVWTNYSVLRPWWQVFGGSSIFVWVHKHVPPSAESLRLEHPVSIRLPLNLESSLVTGFLQAGGRTVSNWFVVEEGGRGPHSRSPVLRWAASGAGAGRPLWHIRVQKCVSVTLQHWPWLMLVAL
jgi:hypothetical protein